MESMFTRKKTVAETEQMISAIPVQDIRAEIRRLALVERSRLAALEGQRVFEQRMHECERLNVLIKRENPQLTDSVFEKPGNATRENPFFQALKAQKEERERYKHLLELAIQNGELDEGDSLQAEQEASVGLRKLADAGAEDEANDVFQHTYVDVPDAERYRESE